ncbi:M23 family metallopeptidase [Streptomyces sp. NPDC058001]|uniref:M23 family metallopeptidase n=1 Tax=Streptomyces sp. NPDC058001 TaxID=3346300 RepID=UPI0036E888B7
MFKRATSDRPITSLLRTRKAVIAGGLGVSMLLGGGVAAAVGTGQAVTAAPSSVAANVHAQADAQAKAAQAKPQTVTVKAPAAAKAAPAWVKPVDKYSLSAGFAQAGGMWAHKHSGQDFAVPVGTPVKAASAGTVVKAGGNGGGDGPAYGNAIVVKHSNGKYSQYAHLSKINVKIGQSVSAGQNIALSGNTGNSSGPHLHFEIRTTPNYGSAISPMAFLRSVGVGV